MLGFASFAHFRLADSMAQSPDAVRELLNSVWGPAKRRLADEQADCGAEARREGSNAPLQAADWRHYAEKVRKRQFDFDEAELKPYLSLDA